MNSQSLSGTAPRGFLEPRKANSRCLSLVASFCLVALLIFSGCARDPYASQRLSASQTAAHNARLGFDTSSPRPQSAQRLTGAQVAAHNARLGYDTPAHTRASMPRQYSPEQVGQIINNMQVMSDMASRPLRDNPPPNILNPSRPLVREPITYRKIGDTVRGSDGTTIRRVGDTIVVQPGD
jgi:hypothetical protein